MLALHLVSTLHASAVAATTAAIRHRPEDHLFVALMGQCTAILCEVGTQSHCTMLHVNVLKKGKAVLGLLGLELDGCESG